MTSYPAVLATNTTRVHLFALLFIVLVAAIVVAFVVIAFVVIFRGRLRPAPGEPADRPVDSPSSSSPDAWRRARSTRTSTGADWRLSAAGRRHRRPKRPRRLGQPSRSGRRRWG